VSITIYNFKKKDIIKRSSQTSIKITHLVDGEDAMCDKITQDTDEDERYGIEVDAVIGLVKVGDIGS
jgi:hypothetical protein